jgi:hypothetical protein
MECQQRIKSLKMSQAIISNTETLPGFYLA